jgi:hypothetical protein
VKFGRKPKLTALQIELARKQIERGEDKGQSRREFQGEPHHPLPGACLSL